MAAAAVVEVGATVAATAERKTQDVLSKWGKGNKLERITEEVLEGAEATVVEYWVLEGAVGARVLFSLADVNPFEVAPLLEEPAYLQNQKKKKKKGFNTESIF